MISAKTWRVARTEYLQHLRSKAFILSLVLMPLLMGGSIFVNALTKDHKDLSPRKIAVIDPSGDVVPLLQAASAQRDQEAVYEEEDGERKQVEARWLFDLSEASPADLSEAVRKEELFAYLVLPEGLLSGASKERVAYHTNTPTYGSLPRWIEGALNAVVRAERFQRSGVDPNLVKELTQPIDFGRYGLVTRDTSGGLTEAKEVDEIRTYVIPMVSLMLMFMLVMMSGPTLLNSVLEEKMQRISEVLVAAVAPSELFLGKVLGSVFIAWTLSALYLGGLATVAHQLGFGDVIQPSLVAWFLVLQLLALLIYGSIFSALGAACSELKDAQTMMLPAMVLVMLPMFTFMNVIESPGGSLAVFLSIFPPSAPFIMLMRLGVPPGPALWEIIAALASTITFTLVAVWAAGRIFRIGILSHGQTPGLKQLVAWIFQR